MTKKPRTEVDVWKAMLLSAATMPVPREMSWHLPLSPKAIISLSLMLITAEPAQSHVPVHGQSLPALMSLDHHPDDPCLIPFLLQSRDEPSFTRGQSCQVPN